VVPIIIASDKEESNTLINKVPLVLASMLPLAMFLFANPQGAVLRHVVKNPGGVLSVAFSPDGEMVVCGGENTLRMYNVGTGALVRSFIDQEAVINSVALSPRGDLLAAADDDGAIRIWNPQTGEQKSSILVHMPHETKGSHDYRVLCLRFSPDGRTLASGSGGFECLDCAPYGEVKLWDVRTGRLLSALPRMKEYVWSIAFLRGGRVIATTGAGGAVTVWNLETGTRTRALVQKAPVLSVAVSSGGKYLVAAGEDTAVTVWDTRTWELSGTIRGFKSRVLSVAVSPNGRIVAAGEYDSVVKVSKIGTKDSYSVELPRASSVNSVAISPDGKALAVGTAEGLLILWITRL
jgi:WD40 repeat protein